MNLLNDHEVAKALASLSGWLLVEVRVTRSYHFATFPEAITFVNCVAQIAESENHHPDIHILYRTVRLSVTTHEANGITSRDIRFARSLNAACG